MRVELSSRRRLICGLDSLLLRVSTFVVLAALFVTVVRSQSFPIGTLVQTDNGDVQGYQDEATGTFAFLGIPFAQPPLNDLRWTSPLAAASWSDVYNATYYRPSCIQGLGLSELYTATSEDCLYLNVFVPSGTIVNDTSDALPVRVFIHGGGFTQGGAIMYDSKILSALSNSVVVTINYRLGVFGFLATSNLVAEDPTLNWGIQDQQLALSWVQDNIFNFGGDPTNVLIFGESAGGASVVFHLIIQNSWGLYNRVLTESPGPWWYLSTSTAVAINERTIIESGNCTDLSLDCLRQLPADVLNNMVHLNQIPVVNGQAGDLADQPYRLVRNGLINTDVDYLIGSNANEGNVFAFEADGALIDITSDQMSTVISQFVVSNFLPTSFIPKIIDIFEPIQDTQGNFASAAGFGGDFFITCGTRNLVNSIYNYTRDNDYDKSQIWRYVFSHHPSNWTIGPVSLSILNATHGTELSYVFGDTIFGVILNNDEELELSKQIIEYWTQFTSCGNPNGIVGVDDSYGAPSWPAYDPANANTTIFNLNTGFGLAEDLWGVYCEQLESLIFFNSTLPF